MINTPENITELEPNQIFVFGSNPMGFHGAGAAKLAHDKFGAIYRQGYGPQGQSYAIATTNLVTKIPLYNIEDQVRIFFVYARNHTHLEFLVTKIGCGLAGYTEDDVAPLFKGAPDNVILPEGWER